MDLVSLRELRGRIGVFRNVKRVELVMIPVLVLCVIPSAFKCVEDVKMENAGKFESMKELKEAIEKRKEEEERLRREEEERKRRAAEEERRRKEREEECIDDEECFHGGSVMNRFGIAEGVERENEDIAQCEAC